MRQYHYTARLPTHIKNYKETFIQLYTIPIKFLRRIPLDRYNNYTTKDIQISKPKITTDEKKIESIYSAVIDTRFAPPAFPFNKAAPLDRRRWFW